jgi:hypothetical protein
VDGWLFGGGERGVETVAVEHFDEWGWSWVINRCLVLICVVTLLVSC